MRCNVCATVFEILVQDVNVYQLGGSWCFANAGIISDGFESKEQAEIAALKKIIKVAKSQVVKSQGD